MYGLASGSEVAGHEVPVDQVPERLDVLRASVAVVNVVGVFPDVAGQQRGVTAGHRVACANGAGQGQGAVRLLHQPAPAGTEGADGNLAELFLELVEGAEGSVDGVGQRASRLTTTVGLHAVPIEGVVPHLGGIVEDATGGGLDDLFQRLAFELGARNQVVQVHHVGVVVLAVVIFQRLGRDVRLEGVLCIRQSRQFKSHGRFSFVSSGQGRRPAVDRWRLTGSLYSLAAKTGS